MKEKIRKRKKINNYIEAATKNQEYPVKGVLQKQVFIEKRFHIFNFSFEKYPLRRSNL